MNLDRRSGSPEEEEWDPIGPDLSRPTHAGPLGPKRLKTWSLVLSARAIPHLTGEVGSDRELLVPRNRREDALEQLRLFEKENRHWPPPLPPERQPYDNLLPTLSLLILLATFHNLTLLPVLPGMSHPIDWFFLGSADAGKILSGQWWRLATSLTLHADWLHLTGNIVIGGIFVARLCRDLGSGLGWSLFLTSGILGNLINAWLQTPDHRAVGASTAVFGAVGALAAIGMVRYRKNLSRRWPLPIAAAAALLALLGSSGERTDLGAHLFGFFSGLCLGAMAELWMKNYGPPGRRLNVFLALGSATLVGGAWWAALTYTGGG